MICWPAVLIHLFFFEMKVAKIDGIVLGFLKHFSNNLA